MGVGNSMVRMFLILVGFLALISTLNSQNITYKFKDYNTKDGLSNNRVLNVMVDSENYVWVSTLNGYNRFDGVNFNQFRSDSKDSLSIIDNHIRVSLEDDKGRIWIGTGGAGICYFNKKTNEFHKVAIPDLPNASASQDRNFIDKNGNAWFGLNTEESHMVRVDSELNVTVYDSLWGKNAYCKDNDALYFFRKSKIEKCILNNGKLSKLELVHLFNEPTSVLSTYVHKNHIWFGTSDNIYVLNTVNNEVLNLKKYLKSKNIKSFKGISLKKIRALYVDFRGNLWFAIGSKLYELKMDNGELVNHAYAKSNVNPKTIIAGITGNQGGIIWLIYPNQGIGKIVINTNKLKHYLPSIEKKAGLSTDIVRAIYADSNDIWIGTFNKGLDRYNFKKEKYYNYKLKENGAFKNLIVRSVFKEGNKLWVCAGGAGNVYSVVDNGGKISENDFKIYKLDDAGKIIYKDEHGRLWVGTRKSLFYYSKARDVFQKVDLPFNLNVSSIVCKEDNELWLGTWLKGLVKLTINTLNDSISLDSYERLMPGAKQNSIPDNRISSLHLDSTGMLWIGTWGHGLVTYNTENNKEGFSTYKHPLLDNTVYSVLSDNSGLLWLATNNGLFSYNPKTNEHQIYYESDGLLSSQFYQGAYAKSTDESLIFGGVNGMVQFNPDELKKVQVEYKPFVTDLLIENKHVRVGELHNDKVYLNSDIKYQKNITLSYNVDFFELQFNSLNYQNPEDLRYAYKLEGFNTEFIQTTSNSPNAIFTKVPPGKYVLKVKAASKDLIWSNEIEALKIKINPAWWQTFMFKILTAVLILALVLIFYKIRVINIERQNVLLERNVTERTNALQVANNELKDRNAEILERREEINQQNEELNTINEKLNKQNNELESTLSELKETQSQLVLSEKMASIGTLVSGIAHEINNPLNSIKGGKTLIEFYFQDNVPEHNESLQPYFKMIDEGVFRAANIVQSLNRFSRQSDDDTIIVNVNEIIDNCLVIIENKLKYKVDIVRDFCDNPPTVSGYEGQLHQVFLNLLNNAEQSIKDKGKIEICTKVVDEKVVVDISDNGDGIKNEHLDRITDAFFTTKAPGEGTGLGLSIVYNIVTKHKGTIKFKSELNKGTLVNVMLPFCNGLNI